MRNRSSSSIVDETRGSSWHRPVRALIVLAFLFVLAACPPPVSNTLATIVADKLSPTLTITSPGTGQSYAAAVTFTGTVTDDAAGPGDGKGVLRSIEYSVANNVLLRGKILISPEGTAQQVTSYGSGAISWIHATKTFSFTFSTVTPSPIHGLVTVTVNAADANGNVTSQVVQLSEGTGPIITLSSPADALYTCGTTRITLTGKVANAWDDPGSAANISSISWGVTGKPWGATLNLAAGQLSVQNTGFSVNENFTYDTGTRTFTTSFVVPFINDTQLILTVTAMDLNGHTTTHTTVLVADVSGPQLTLDPTTGLFYSSVHFTPATVSGAILLADVPTVKAVTYLVTGSGFSLGPIQVYSNTGTPSPANFFDANGRFSFTLGGADLTGKHGLAQVTITIPDQSNISTIAQFPIDEDSTSPDITITSIRSNNGLNTGYAKIDDTVTFDFQVSDSKSGMAGDPTMKIEGVDVILAPLGGGAYRAQHQMKSSPVPDADVVFAITATDRMGNSGTISNAANNVKYYAGSPPLSSVTVASNPLHPAWAASGDTVTLGFTFPRDLSAAPAVVLAGHAFSFPPPFSPTLHSYTAAWTLSDADTEGPVHYSIGLTDAAGNTLVPADTTSGVTFDHTPPAAFTVTIGQSVINSQNAGSMTFTLTGAEAGTTCASVVIDRNGSRVTGGGPGTGIDVRGLADGLLTLTVTLADPAGNATSESATVTKDATAPASFSVTIGQSIINSQNAGSMTFTLTGAEAGTTCTSVVTDHDGSRVNGGGPGTGIDVRVLADGLLTLTVTLADAAGNTRSESATVNKDATPPASFSANIDQPNITATNMDKMSFTFQQAEVGTSYEYTVTSTGGGPTVSGNGTVGTSNQQVKPIDASLLGDGTLTLTVTLTDAAGNTTSDTDTVNKSTS